MLAELANLGLSWDYPSQVRVRAISPDCIVRGGGSSPAEVASEGQNQFSSDHATGASSLMAPMGNMGHRLQHRP